MFAGAENAVAIYVVSFVMMMFLMVFIVEILVIGKSIIPANQFAHN